jgi:outer membrane biosynthesis protein TonB
VRIRISLVRFLLEAGFLVLVAAAAGLADLSAVWIGVVMLGAWLLVVFVERAGARGAPLARHSDSVEPEPEPEPVLPEAVVEPPEPEPEPDPEPQSEPEPEPEPEPQPRPEPVLAAVPSLPEPEPEPPEAEAEPEPVPEVVPLALHDRTPRAWNIWDLEQLASTMDGDPEQVEERALLLLNLREFASAAGELPSNFDPLVREAFGADLAELVT